MKIIFLDIDGVLCTWRAHYAWGQRGGLIDAIDRVTAAVLERICEGTDTRLVITSQRRSQREECLDLLAEARLARHLHADWRVKPGGRRGDEIRDWLTRHPEVTDYVILDDDFCPDFDDEQERRLVLCNNRDGLGFSGMQRLYRWSRLPAWLCPPEKID